jgi:hypothetical protein
MKITTYEQIKRDIELPKYFMSGNSYFMIIDEVTLLRVKDYSDEDAHLEIYPLIERANIRYFSPILASHGFEEISETQFKLAFIRVSLRLEKMMN